MTAGTRICMSCGKAVHGRADKKFCNDQCRNEHNNRMNSAGNKYVRMINYYLRRNRRILENCLATAQQNAKTTRQKLMNKGFRFNYFTHTYTDRKGKLFYCCYDYGYQLQDKDFVMVMRCRDEDEE